MLEQAETELGGTFDDRRDVLDPGPGADLNRPPAEVEDERNAQTIAAAERAPATRPARRSPRRAVPARVHACRHERREQLDHIAAVLETADPARVYGVYRVPDRFDVTRNSERGRTSSGRSRTCPEHSNARTRSRRAR